MFRIAWQYKDGRTSGHGEYIFKSAEEAQPIIEDANRRHPDINHWAEEEEWPELIG